MFTGRYFLKYLLLLTMVRFAIPPRNGLRRVPHCRHPWFLGTLVKQEIMTDGHGWSARKPAKKLEGFETRPRVEQETRNKKTTLTWDLPCGSPPSRLLLRHVCSSETCPRSSAFPSSPSPRWRCRPAWPRVNGDGIACEEIWHWIQGSLKPMTFQALTTFIFQKVFTWVWWPFGIRPTKESIRRCLLANSCVCKTLHLRLGLAKFLQL